MATIEVSTFIWPAPNIHIHEDPSGHGMYMGVPFSRPGLCFKRESAPTMQFVSELSDIVIRIGRSKIGV